MLLTIINLLGYFLNIGANVIFFNIMYLVTAVQLSTIEHMPFLLVNLFDHVNSLISFNWFY